MNRWQITCDYSATPLCIKKQISNSLAGDKQRWVYSFNFWSLWEKEVGNSEKLYIRIKQEEDIVPHISAGIKLLIT